MSPSTPWLTLAAVLVSPPAFGQARGMRPDDVFALKAVGDPQLSPDGKLVAFLSAREGKKVQVFLLDRRGGEAVRLTDYGADVSDLAWSPDGRRLALVVQDPDPDDPDLAEVESAGDEDGPTPKPIVIQRRQFKRDGEGYLRTFRAHLHVVEVESKASVQVTAGPYDDSEPAWSPGGRLRAFVSNRTPDPDANQNTDVFVVEPRAGAVPRALTTSPGADAGPAFSPDGRLLAFEAGGDPADLWYGTNHVAVVPVAGGEPLPLTRALDRNVEKPEFGADGTFVYFLLEDGGNRHLARVPARGGAVERVLAGERHVEAFDLGPQGEVVVLEGGPRQPFEVSALSAAGGLRRLTHVNDAFLAGLRLAPVERFLARSPDGTMVDGFKAAISGSSEANYLSNYGTDHYQYEWEMELGLPWRQVDLWVRLSPWFQVEKITTPTLFLCGAEDMNVPLLNSEQLFQALKRLGRQTELVIYPGQGHDIETPSYLVDRFERYLAWYDRFLQPAPAAADAPRPPEPEATSLAGRPLFSPPIAEPRRKVLEGNLAQARAEFSRDPDRADSIIWLGRRTAYLGRFREAIAVYTRGIEKHPEDIRLYRHRGHRYISVRELDKAVADLQRAASLIVEKAIPDAVEPDGDPNPRNIPTSTSHFNVYYHLGLAYYLRGEFDQAAAAYRECLKYSQGSPDRLVATSDWLYMALRRLGREDEARQVLAPITRDLEVIENHAYWNRLLMYKGEKTPEELLGPRPDGVELATYGYGVGHWYLVAGQKERAREIFERVVAGAQWPAFGFIAAEAELARR